MTMEVMVEATGLVKRYGEVTALDGLDLVVPKGTVFGLLGPNGAGKTTAVSILSTLLEPDEGSARVAGCDLLTEPAQVRKNIGLSGQYAAVDEYLTGYENLDMIGRLYRLGSSRSKARAKELLEIFDLEEAGQRPVKTYSGGMRRRLDLACALVARPPVLFLDEPTTGLDPRSRQGLWEVIQYLVEEQGRTFLLTTQYMEEAERLADNILVIDRGRAIARGAPDELKAQVGGERVEISTATDPGLGRAREVMERIAVGELQVYERTRTLVAPITGGAAVLTEALKALQEAEVTVVDAGLRSPTLNDVFLTLTGRAAEPDDEEEGEETPAAPQAAEPEQAGDSEEDRE